MTAFSPGKWIGVILDKPKGKNNGTVQGKEYFRCEENHGIFVRPSQVVVLDGSGSSSADSTSADRSKIPMKISALRKPRSYGKLLNKEDEGHEQHSMLRRPSKSAVSLKLTSSSEKLKESLVEVSGGSSSNENVSVRSTISSDVVSPVDTSGDLPKSFVSEKVAQLEARDIERTAAESGAWLPPSNMSESVELEYLRNEVRDLTSKLETLRIKRQEDKQKFVEFEKCKIQLQQLKEFKLKITESNAELQRQLQQAKKDAKEAMEAREQFQTEGPDVAEMIEMATLDKEMAEEKAEMLQQKLATMEEHLVDVESELEMIKREISEKGVEFMSSNLHEKQLEEQNERLREALVRIRDISTHDKRQIQRLMKEIQSVKDSSMEIQRKNENFTRDVENYERLLSELKEQVDVAMGAEEMVEQLTEKNLHLESKLRETEESIEDYEQMHQIDEEMHEGLKESMKELNLELDKSNCALNEAMQWPISFSYHYLKRELEKSQSQVIEKDSIVCKYRERTAQLQQELDNCKEEIERLIGAAQKQSEKECLFPGKFNLLQTRAWSECPMAEDGIKKEHVLQSHKAELWSFLSKFRYYINALAVMLYKFQSALLQCSVERLSTLAQLRLEICNQEKSIDYYFEVFKRNDVDEKTSLDNLQKAIAYFKASSRLFDSHLEIETFNSMQPLKIVEESLGSVIEVADLFSHLCSQIESRSSMLPGEL
ncbi:unnamed protein product [Soboliphyme baturini]|uniref:Dynactin subunit 1 n=1 Tax=Soboliphyme baturini TaxID=241478 RepID=A0A183ISW0_9BILA|nr:unnamed protein product [Soboliphyme baturini]